MTKTGFVIANLFRKKTRTTLTLLSVIMAFLLFGLLQSLNHIFDAGPNFLAALNHRTRGPLHSAFESGRSCIGTARRTPG